MKRSFSVAVLCSLLAVGSGVGQTPHFSNSILNLYDAFGSGRRGTVPGGVISTHTLQRQNHSFRFRQ